MPRSLSPLAKSLARFRAPVARGLAAPPADLPRVDRTGGQFGAGLIRGVAVCTAGEALGHDLWLDETFLAQVAGWGAAATRGVKARFTHPGLSADGLGTYLGRFVGFRSDGPTVRADLHLAEAAHNSPEGDLAAYVMDLAEEDPGAFGVSIVFRHDPAAEMAFIDDHGGPTGFASPDPDNVEHYPHARLRSLDACDCVDTPAANPDGMFSAVAAGPDIPAEALALFDYALGVGPRPLGAPLDLDPDRFRAFVARAMSLRGISFTRTEPTNMDPTTNPAPSAPLDATATATATELGAPTAPVNPSPAGPTRGAGEFLRRWGQPGAVWFAEGRTWEEAEELAAAAQAAELEALRAQVADLQAKLAHRQGAAAPVSASPSDAPAKRTAKPVEPKGVDRFAQAIAGKIPGRSTVAQ